MKKELGHVSKKQLRKSGIKVKAEKSIDEVLQEEFLRERAAVLAKASEKLVKTLQSLSHIEESIIRQKRDWDSFCLRRGGQGEKEVRNNIAPNGVLNKINEKIDAFNHVREKAKIHYYYLIVTREALGLRKHHWVEDLYPIPRKKKRIEVP